MSQWYYKLQGKEYGPVTTEEIRKLVESKELKKNSSVRPAESKRWKKIRQFKEFDRRNVEPPIEKLHHFVELPGEKTGTTGSEQLWVLLRRVKKGSETSFKQSGPFSSRQVFQKLNHGQAEFSDYVWRQGFDRWHRIGDLDEFDRRSEKDQDEKQTAAGAAPENDHEDSEIDGGVNSEINEDTFAQTFPDLVTKTMSENITSATNRFLSSVISKVGLDLKEASEKVDHPEEEVGPELTEMPIEEKLLLSLSQRRVLDPRDSEEKPLPGDKDLESTGEFQEENPLEEAKLHVLPPAPPKASSKKERETLESGDATNSDEPVESVAKIEPLKRREKLKAIRRAQRLIGLLMLFAVGLLGWTIFSYIALDKNPIENIVLGGEGSEEKKTPSKPEKVASLVKAPPEKAVEEKNVAKKATKKAAEKDIPPPIVKNPTLKLQFAGMDTSNAVAIVSSNAARGQKIYLTVHGRTGKVLEEFSFTKSVTLEKKDGQDSSIKFKSLGAPFGQYEVLVESANSSTRRPVFFGQNTSVFHSKMKGHLKRISHQHQAEKKQLFYLTKAYILRFNRFLQRLKSERNSRSWRRFYRGWSSEFRSSTISELEGYSHSERNGYAFPDHWEDLAAYRQDVFKFTAEFKNDNPTGKVKSMEAEMSIILANLSSFKEKVGDLSMQR